MGKENLKNYRVSFENLLEKAQKEGNQEAIKVLKRAIGGVDKLIDC